MAEYDDETTIIGGRPRPRSRIQIIALALCVLVAGLLAFRDIASGRPRTFVAFLWPYILLFVISTVLRFRPPTVIDGHGIRRPWRKRAFIPWDEVRSVISPDPAFYLTRLKLEDGTTIELPGLPVARSAAIAALGHKQVTRDVPAIRPSPEPRERSAQEIEADVGRRAAALAAQREALKAESRRIRREDW